MEFDLGEDGKRCRTVFISWVPGDTAVKVGFLLLFSICFVLTLLCEVLTIVIALYDLCKHQGAVE